MKQDQKENVKKRTQELLRTIYERKKAIAEEYKDNAKEKIKEYMKTLEYTEVRKEIIELNLNFIKSRVIDIIGNYDEKYLSYGVDGMARAIDAFDYSKGYSLLTYARMWVDRFIMESAKTESDNKCVPNYKIDKIKQAISKLGDDSPKLLSQETNFDILEIARVLEALKTPVSLYFTPEDSEHELYETIQDNDKPIEKIVEQRALKEQIEQLLKHALNDQEYKVIKLRYGFEGDILTYEQIGKIIGVSRQRAMEIGRRALSKMRRYTKMMGLDDYREDSKNSDSKRTFF